MSEEFMMYTFAQPTEGVFPLTAIREALETALWKTVKIVPDYFGTRKKLWWEEYEASRSIRKEGYELVLAHINQEELRFGDVPSVQIDGETVEGFKLDLTIGEKAIVIRFTHLVSLEKRDLAAEVIPRMKELIVQVFPNVQFEDRLVKAKKL